MIPADLLSALREKDPELCGRMRRMPVYVHQDEQLTIDLTKSDNTELVAAWLQHCLQEAIRWRGYSYKLKYLATSQIAIADIYFENSTWSAEGTTEAEALCRAYLAAIQEVS